MLTATHNHRHTVLAREKKRAGIGVPMISGGQPPSVRYFFVRDVSFMGRLYGVQQCTPVPLTRYANLYSLAHPDWRQGRQVSETCKRRHIMSNALSQFNFQQKAVRTAIINNEINFCLADVCDCLELQNPTHTANQIKEEFELTTLNVGSFDTGFGVKELTLITEPQLYFVMMRSRSALARTFRKWICEEVLPAIRKTGGYIHEAAMKPAINYDQYLKLQKEASDAVSGWLRMNTQHICNHLRVIFSVRRVQDIPAEHFETARAIIQSKREAVKQFHAAVIEIKDWFEKEVLSGGMPWTPSIQRMLTKKLKRQVILPPKVDWLALAEEVKKPVKGKEGGAK